MSVIPMRLRWTEMCKEGVTVEGGTISEPEAKERLRTLPQLIEDFDPELDELVSVEVRVNYRSGFQQIHGHVIKQ